MINSENKHIIDQLNKDQVKNISIINFIENYPVHFIDRIGESVILKGTSDREWVYISSSSKEELEEIKLRKLMAQDVNFAVIEEWMLPTLIQNRRVSWQLPTWRLVLPEGVVNLKETTLALDRLNNEDAEFIYNSSDYKDFLSIDYIKERISNGIHCCIREEDKPIAWGITQDDGAIGFLHVLLEHRRRGLARWIMIEMINQVRSSGKIPFVHIEEDNEASMTLALSLGFIKDRVVSWFKLE